MFVDKLCIAAMIQSRILERVVLRPKQRGTSILIASSKIIDLNSFIIGVIFAKYVRSMSGSFLDVPVHEMIL